MEYIDLDRTYFALPVNYTEEAQTDELDLRSALGFRAFKDINRDTLLEKPRVVLLAEAGAGKTSEMKRSACLQKERGHYSFFIRLENISDGLEYAIEGDFGCSHEDFLEWEKGQKKAWFFFDSVDESRLKDSSEFERAINIVSRLIRKRLDDASIVISSRVHAWRAQSDLAFCNQRLRSESRKTSKSSKAENETEGLESKAGVQSVESEKSEGVKFEVYALTDLSKAQVRAFADSKGVSEIDEFLGEIERFQAWAYTERPQDLDELISYWDAKKQLGSHFDLLKNSIERRLTERDQKRAERNCLSPERAREGAKILAAACILQKESSIQIQDGADKNNGVFPPVVLREWNTAEIKELLSLPIFENGSYGYVRFHHRSAREYLCAEWLNDKLSSGADRRLIEGLIFRNKYGRVIITPTMNPVLSWLVLLDERICNRAFESAPEFFFTGGDPCYLTRELREHILSLVCEKIAEDIVPWDSTGYEAVARFTNADLKDVISSLLKKYEGNRDVTLFLLRLIWQGKILDLYPQAREIITKPWSDKYIAIQCIRMARESLSICDYKDYLDELEELDFFNDDRVVGEIIEGLEPSRKSVEFLERLIPNKKRKERINDPMISALRSFSSQLSGEVTRLYLELMLRYLQEEPRKNVGRYSISEDHYWMMTLIPGPVIRLIEDRDEFLLGSRGQDIILSLCANEVYGSGLKYHKEASIKKAVNDWKELKYSLFWDDIGRTKKAWKDRDDRDVTYPHQGRIGFFNFRI